MAAEVVPLILDVWRRANAKLVEIPIRTADKAIQARIVRKWKTLQNIAAKNGNVSKRERKSFPKELDRLFDILTCGCEFKHCIEMNCKDADCSSPHINCNCPREAKIPKLDLPFIKDQRQKCGSKGQLQMALKDQKETTRQVEADKRKKKEEEREETRKKKQKKEEEELRSREEAEEEEEEASVSPEVSAQEIDVDPDFQNERVERKIRSETHELNRTPLPTVASVAVRSSLRARFNVKSTVVWTIMRI